MYLFDTVKPCLIGQIGFRNHRSTVYEPFDSSIVASGTQRIVNHPLINVENLQLVITEFNDYGYAEWDSGTAYDFDERVQDASANVYKSIIPGVDSNTGNALTDTASWTPISKLSLYLEAEREFAARDIMDELLNKKKDKMNTKALFSNMAIYEGPGNIYDKIVKTGSLVGLEINLKRHQNLRMIIDRIGTQFDTAQGIINFYLYHSSQLRPIQTITLNLNKASSFEWSSVSNVFLDYLNNNYDSAGVFYLVYDENDITGQAIDKRFDFSRPCPTCSRYNLKAFNTYYKFASIRSIRIDSSNRLGVDNLDLWDINNTTYVNPTNFGLNLAVTVKCDLSDFICDQRIVFAEAMDLSLTKNLLNHMVNNTRDNDKQTKLFKQATVALRGDPVEGGNRVIFTGGIKEQYDRVIENLDFDTSDLNTSCLPCNTKTGIKIRSIGTR